MNSEDLIIIRFALSFLSANLHEAVFADFDFGNAMNWSGTEAELEARIQGLREVFLEDTHGK